MLDADTFTAQERTVEFANDLVRCVIGRDIEQSVPLFITRRVRDKDDSAADDLWTLRKRQAKPCLKDSIREFSQVFPCRCVRNPGYDQLDGILSRQRLLELAVRSPDSSIRLAICVAFS
jgi:hypothetical protein